MNAAWLALACLIGFVLLVVATCSSPISKDITLFAMSLSEGENDTGGEIRAGVLGFCFDAAIQLISESQPVSQVAPRSSLICTPTNLGYQIVMARNQTSGPLQLSNFETVVGEDLTQAMIFNPLGATIAGLSMFVSLFAAYGGRRTNITAASLTFLAMIFAWIAFAVNIGISLMVKSEIENAQNLLTEGEVLQFTWGAASFLPLAAALILTGAVVWWGITKSWRPKAAPNVVQQDEPMTTKT